MISWIILTRCRPLFLRLAIRCFISQKTDEPKELVVVCDGDVEALSDPLVSIIQKYGQVVTCVGRATIGEKRNIGKRVSKGEFVFFADDDDWYSPGRVAAQLPALRDGRAGVSVLQDSLSLDTESARYYSRIQDRVSDATIACTRRAFEEAGGFAHRDHGETEAFLGAALQGKPGLALDQNQGEYIYMRHRSNITDAGIVFQDFCYRPEGRPDFFPADAEAAYCAAAKKGG